MTQKKQKPLSYQQAGVDIEKGNALVKKIKTFAKRTHRPGVLTGIGGFGALFEISKDRFKNPVLVSGTDGVGTKLKLAVEMNHHDSIGIDLVAMCANDIVTLGAEPLFFLDYFSTSKLDLKQAETIVQSIAKGCELAGAALIGGETAEMPGLYPPKEYDLAGFCVGVVEKDRIIDGSQVHVDDALIGIASSGPHSNGYSLIRKILEQNNTDLNQPFGKTTLGKVLLTPTRIYVSTLLKLIKAVNVHAIAHITGGGLIENLPRVLPDYTQAAIDLKTWKPPKIFQWIQENGNLSADEMRRTFNLGIGMVICVPKESVDKTLELLNNFGENAFKIGDILKSSHEKPAVLMD